MAFDLSDLQFFGPALPAPYVKFELEKELSNLKILPKTTGEEGKVLREEWGVYRRQLRSLAASGGAIRVRNHIIEPLLGLLKYSKIEQSPDIQTREDRESGGWLLLTDDGTSKLRVWTTSFNEDLLAPSKRGRAYRYSHQRIAQRVLLATGERLGLLTNGVQLVILISDPARPDSTVTISVDPGWKRSRDIPDSFRFLLAIACPAGVKAIPDIVDKARLQQARVTKELRVQARQAVEGFIQEIIDHPSNKSWYDAQTDRDHLAKALWREGLIIIYRLLAILKLESNDDPARTFTFASTSLWRNTYSPSMALAGIARNVLGKGAETGSLLESGMKSLFRMLETGLECSELSVKPLGGALFGKDTTPILSNLAWGERAVAWLLDRLLWTPKKRGAETRERVHYGSLNVEDLGRVYEALLELEPGITSEPMCRLRRQKLEVVVPVVQGEKYRPVEPVEIDEIPDQETSESEDSEEEAEETPVRGKKTKVEWIEEINPNRFYLRVGLGRKASGSYYTPHSFVRFLVQETLGPQVAERSPQDDPKPVELLKLKVLDPAMGSGHFLVEACRFLGDKLYEACRLCDEKALAAERRADKSGGTEKDRLLEEARRWRLRVIDLPDPEDELLKYLPSRSPEGEESGLSQKRAEALCRRLVATHCLYGVDKNPLAVELAKLSLWLESHAEGMPLTFLDHRLIVGDSLTGPFWHHLIFKPGNPKEPISNLFQQNLDMKFTKALSNALDSVRDLDSSIGISVIDIEGKKKIKADLDRALLPFHIAAAAWSGGVMLGSDHCDDDAYAEMLQVIADTGDLPERIGEAKDSLVKMITRGLGVDDIPSDRERLYELIESGKCVPALPYDLTFPEVFYPNGVPHGKRGFNAILGNPPWDAIKFNSKEFFAAFDFAILDAPTKRERESIESRIISDQTSGKLFEKYKEEFEQQKRINDHHYEYQKVFIEGDLAGRQSDSFRVFMERNTQLMTKGAYSGVVVPSAFHANEGATGVRQLYLEKMKLTHCYSFENRRKLFEIHSSFKFALVVVQSGAVTDKFSCAFYLHDDEWLFGERKYREPLEYKYDFVRKTGGEYLSLLELKSDKDHEISEICFLKGESFGVVCERSGIRLGSELHMTNDSWRFTPTSEVLPGGEDPRDPDVARRLLEMGYLVLHEGKTIWQFDDHWGIRPRELVSIHQMLDKPEILKNSQYFRLAYRAIQNAENVRTFILTLTCPGSIFGNSAPCDRDPVKTSNQDRLKLQAVCSSFICDWALRLRATANINLFIINATQLPVLEDGVNRFLAHNSLRLICNHMGYKSLWYEQVGNHWIEGEYKSLIFPVISSIDDRREIRAAIEAVIAYCFDLKLNQLKHILSTFKHTEFPKAPELCLSKFDELKQIGLEAFTKKYDPYWDIPLNENLPQPDPVVSAAIEKYLGSAEVRETEGGRESGGRRKAGGKGAQKRLFE